MTGVSKVRSVGGDVKQTASVGFSLRYLNATKTVWFEIAHEIVQQDQPV